MELPAQVHPPALQAHQRLEQKPSFQLIDQQIPVIKVIVVGEPFTGKTSLLRSYTKKDFSISYEKTVRLAYYHQI